MKQPTSVSGEVIRGLGAIAAAVHMSIPTARNLILRGELKGVRKLGRSWIVTRSALLSAVTPEESRDAA